MESDSAAGNRAVDLWAQIFAPFPLGQFREVTESLIVIETHPGHCMVYVRELNAVSCRTATEYAGRGVPVHVYYPASLEGIGGVAAKDLTLTLTVPVDPTPLYALSDRVTDLALNGNVCQPGELQVDRLSGVHRLAVSWDQVDQSKPFPRSVRRLSLFDFSRTLDEIRSSWLESLTVYSARRMPSLDGVERFSGLGSLAVHDGRVLADVSAASRVLALHELVLDGCPKIDRLTQIAECLGLRTLQVSDCGAIESLAPIRRLQHLERFIAWGSTRVADGDLGPLLELPGLVEIALARRRGYQPSVDHLDAVLEARRPGPSE